MADISKPELAENEIKDLYIRENFRKLKNAVNSLVDNQSTSTSSSSSSESSSAASSLLSSLGTANFGIKATVQSNNLKIRLVQTDGETDIDADSAAPFHFRHKDIDTGAIVERTLESSIELLIPNGATLASKSSKLHRIYLYILDASAASDGGLELAASTAPFNEFSLQSTTAITTSSTSGDILYSKKARTSVPVRLLGNIWSTQTTAGAWAAAPSQIDVRPQSVLNILPMIRFVQLDADGTDFGITNTSCVNFNLVSVDKVQGVMTNNSTSGSGSSITINKSGIYFTQYAVGLAAAVSMGVLYGTSLFPSAGSPSYMAALSYSTATEWNGGSGFLRLTAGSSLKLANTSSSVSAWSGVNDYHFWEVYYLGEILEV